MLDLFLEEADLRHRLLPLELLVLRLVHSLALLHVIASLLQFSLNHDWIELILTTHDQVEE